MPTDKNIEEETVYKALFYDELTGEWMECKQEFVKRDEIKPSLTD
jgi:hypothetical protein